MKALWVLLALAILAGCSSTPKQSDETQQDFTKDLSSYALCSQAIAQLNLPHDFTAAAADPPMALLIFQPSENQYLLFTLTEAARFKTPSLNLGQHWFKLLLTDGTVWIAGHTVGGTSDQLTNLLSVKRDVQQVEAILIGEKIDTREVRNTLDNDLTRRIRGLVEIFDNRKDEYGQEIARLFKDPMQYRHSHVEDFLRDLLGLHNNQPLPDSLNVDELIQTPRKTMKKTAALQKFRKQIAKYLELKWWIPVSSAHEWILGTTENCKVIASPAIQEALIQAKKMLDGREDPQPVDWNDPRLPK